MTNMANRSDDDSATGALHSWHPMLWISVFGFALIVTLMWIAGLFVGHNQSGGGAPSIAFVAMVAVSAGVAALLVWGIYRQLIRIKTSRVQMAKRDRKYVKALWISAALGVLITVIEIIGSVGDAAFSSGALTPVAAFMLAIVVGLALPALCWHWHMRVIDELEAEAYHVGALAAVYTFWIGGPVWWYLWRGGFVGQPDGVFFYFGTMAAFILGWAYKRYR
jgi:hypothetical protein